MTYKKCYQSKLLLAIKEKPGGSRAVRTYIDKTI